MKKGHVLHTTIWGVASRPRSLGFTIGHKKCAANSAKNDSQETNDFGYGGVGWSVKGIFSSRVDWGSHGGYANGTLWIVEIPVTKSGYLCAYLQKGRLNRNNSPTGAVIVRASKYFKVVK